MARIPYLDPDRAPESVKRLLAPDRPQKIALLFGHAESNWPRLADLLLSILGEQELESRLRELAILRVAKLRAARYEWDQHVAIATVAGVRDEQIESIAKGEIGAACFEPRERLALDAATELVRDSMVADSTLARLSQEFPPRQIVELLLACGVYAALAKQMTALGLDPEAAVTSAFAAQVHRGALTGRRLTAQGG
jgi:alkylhydroperoxidase family enzyme